VQRWLYAINGFIYGNLQGLEMNRGDHVRWYVIGLGSVVDVHTPHWHGETVLLDGRTRTDVVELLPASMHVDDMVADNPGTWLFHCHVAPHMRNGMFTTYHVR
jgi:FtsP/CotA-like multicopper oxidase with cupredoxin domain